jgi:hypothetical protein
MISHNQLCRFSFKDHIKFEMQCLNTLLNISNDEFFIADGNEVLKSE